MTARSDQSANPAVATSPVPATQARPTVTRRAVLGSVASAAPAVTLAAAAVAGGAATAFGEHVNMKLVDAAETMAASPAALPGHPDTDLFALHPKLKAAYRTLNEAVIATDNVQRRYWDATPREQRCDALEAAFGLDRAEEAQDAAGDAWAAIVDEMLAIPARTLDGVRFKLAVCHEQWGEPDLLNVIATDIENIGGPIALWSMAGTDIDSPEACGGKSP